MSADHEQAERKHTMYWATMNPGQMSAYINELLVEQAALLARAEAAEEREQDIRDKFARWMDLCKRYHPGHREREWAWGELIDALASRSNTERGRA